MDVVASCKLELSEIMFGSDVDLIEEQKVEGALVLEIDLFAD